MTGEPVGETRRALPSWHETGIPGRALVNATAIAAMRGAPTPAALRSYATGRRTHALYGAMPDPVCKVANRRLWLRTDIETWLSCPFQPYQTRAIAAWIAAGRPR